MLHGYASDACKVRENGSGPELSAVKSKGCVALWRQRQQHLLAAAAWRCVSWRVPRPPQGRWQGREAPDCPGEAAKDGRHAARRFQRCRTCVEKFPRVRSAVSRGPELKALVQGCSAAGERFGLAWTALATYRKQVQSACELQPSAAINKDTGCQLGRQQNLLVAKREKELM